MSDNSQSDRTCNSWWDFIDCDPAAPATGEFIALHAERVGRLYFPLVNEAGMRSWVSPALQGSPAGNHNEYLGVPITAEDLGNNLVHRGFWVVEEGHPPFSLSPLGGGSAADAWRSRAPQSVVNAGPGWFSVVREGPARRFNLRATLWCPADSDEKIEIMTVEVTNRSAKTLRFAAYAAIPLFARSADDVRDHRHVTALLNRVSRTAHGVVSCPTMSFDERGHRVNHTRYGVLAFGPGNRAPAAIWPTQESFLGDGGSFAAPSAVWNREREPSGRAADFQGKEGLGGFRFDECALKPGQSARFAFVSGIAADAGCAARWTRWATGPSRFQRSLERTKEYWQQRIHRVSFGTRDTRLNNWLAWVGFQPMLRRLYGNSYLPQFDYGRGGKGWRDLWQDCLALLLSDPADVKPMLLHNFGGVRIDGSNATIIGTNGGFLADRNNIPRTWMDHGCWPTYTTLLYVDQTGDLDFLLKDREYFRDPQLHRCRKRDTRWTEAYGNELRARNGRVYLGSVFEHMLVQNLTAFYNVGEHNVCRLEGADWNDGLDMADDRGESVAFTAFYAWNLERLAAVAESLAGWGMGVLSLAQELGLLLDRLPGGSRVNYGSARARQDRLARYLDTVERDVSGRKVVVDVRDLARDLRAKSADLSRRIAKQEWVKANRGLEFFNGYYDNHGKRVEGRHAGRARMTLTGQVFPVMAGIASAEQVDRVMRSVDRLLRDPVTRGIRLNTDFGDIQPALGRAFSFAYGEKENGAVFCHMAVMYAFALYLQRRPEAGRKVWSALYCATLKNERSRIFPCVPEYFNAAGRGMYCYLTGTASWLVHLVLTRVFGVRGERGDLVVDPQLLPEEFDAKGGSRVRLHFAERRLEFEFRNPGKRTPGRYRVLRVRHGSDELTACARAEGGVSIPRSVVRRLPAGKAVRLVVELG